MKFEDLKNGKYFAHSNLIASEKNTIIEVESVDKNNLVFYYWDKDRTFLFYMVNDIEEELPLIDTFCVPSKIVTDKIEAPEMVNHPNHYNQGRYEVIDVIEDWDLNFCLGNAVKYIARCNHKGNKKQDLEKAIFYLKRELEKER